MPQGLPVVQAGGQVALVFSELDATSAAVFAPDTRSTGTLPSGVSHVTFDARTSAAASAGASGTVVVVR